MYKKTNYDFSVLISRLKAINFSIAKADLERAIKNQLPRMLENLSLVFLCKHNPAWKHWQGEVIGNISSYNGKTKKGNKFFSKDEYYGLLWGDTPYADSSEKLYELIIDKFIIEREPLSLTMTDYARHKIQNFMDWLSTELSKGKVEKYDIYEQLDADYSSEIC